MGQQSTIRVNWPKVGAMAPGTSVTVSILRNGEPKDLALKLATMPEERPAPVEAASSRSAAPASEQDLGLLLAPASEVAGPGEKGMVVVAIDPKGRRRSMTWKRATSFSTSAARRSRKPRTSAAISHRFVRKAEWPRCFASSRAVRRASSLCRSDRHSGARGLGLSRPALGAGMWLQYHSIKNARRQCAGSV